MPSATIIDLSTSEEYDDDDVPDGPADDAFHRCQLEATTEHGELFEDDAFGAVEEVVAPVERSAHRVMPVLCPAAGGGEEVEVVIEPSRQLAHSERADACRGEFDGQRDAVETT